MRFWVLFFKIIVHIPLEKEKTKKYRPFIESLLLYLSTEIKQRIAHSCTQKMINFLNKLQNILAVSYKIDFLAPLALRFYLAPIMWMAGTQKLENFPATVAWFANPDWGLGLPLPELMAGLVAGSEVLGAIFYCLVLQYAGFLFHSLLP